MTTAELKSRYLGRKPLGSGHFRVGFLYRGGWIFAVTTNTRALDRLDDELPERDYDRYYVTQKQALQALYNEVKRKNEKR